MTKLQSYKMDIEKQPSNTGYAFSNRFYPVGNLRGYSWNPINPTVQTNHILDLPEFNVVRNERIGDTAGSTTAYSGAPVRSRDVPRKRRRGRK